MDFLRQCFGAVLLGAVAACSAHTGTPAVDAAGLQSVPIEAVELPTKEFAPKAAELLREGQPSGERLNVLVAVVRSQLKRARHYFDAGHEAAALDAVTGAMLLVRAGEFRKEMVVGAEQTLMDAAEAVARRGDEGRAEAFYALPLDLLPAGQQRKDIAGHLEALSRWQNDVSGDETMQAAGALRLAAAKRALVWRTPENVEAARVATAQWVDRALSSVPSDEQPMDHQEFDERREAHRAATMGAIVIAALYLRDGDANGAVAALDNEPLSAVASTKLVSRLMDAAQGEPEAWAELFGFFESPQVDLDPDLARGAAWGCAVALYRSAPDDVHAVVPLATLLVDHHMGDVVGVLFDRVLDKRAETAELTWALRMLMRALVTAEEYGDLELARNLFETSQGVINLASAKPHLGRVEPSSPDFLYAMGAMESRAGHLANARGFLARAVKLKPTPQSLRLLAAIDRQQGDLPSALASLTQMLTLVRKVGDLSSEAATQVMIYDLLREQGRATDAASALAAALDRVLAARTVARSGTEIASSERILADVLERYGEAEAARRAVERAGDAARNDLNQLRATVLDAARRALSMGDLKAGRQAVRHALDHDLEDHDLVYAALWVKLLQERLGVPSDGSVEEAFSRVDNDGTWVGALRDWGRGTITDEQLKDRADNLVEQVEAKFYVTLSAHFRSANDATLAQLRAVAGSEAIELVEVRIARDLLFAASNAAPPPPPLPNGINLP